MKRLFIISTWCWCKEDLWYVFIFRCHDRRLLFLSDITITGQQCILFSTELMQIFIKTIAVLMLIQAWVYVIHILTHQPTLLTQHILVCKIMYKYVFNSHMQLYILFGIYGFIFFASTFYCFFVTLIVDVFLYSYYVIYHNVPC